MQEQFLNFNESILPAHHPVFNVSNRAFRYGDGLFETIRVINKMPCFVENHLQRLIKGMTALKMHVPDTYNASYFTFHIKELLEKNSITGDARVRLSVFRNDGGYYTPLSNDVSYVLEAEAIPEQGYELNIKGYNIDVYSEIKKTQGVLANVKSSNSLLYVLAGIYKKQHLLDECVLLNDKGNIIESISYNLFAVKNGVLYTCPIADGCVEGVMRWQIIRLATENKLAVYEISLPLNVLLNSDELFLTNSLNGIRWIGEYKAKRYNNQISKQLTQKLNAKIEALATIPQ